MCSEHGWLPYQLSKISLSSTRLDATREWDRGGPIRGHHTMVPVCCDLLLLQQAVLLLDKIIIQS